MNHGRFEDAGAPLPDLCALARGAARRLARLAFAALGIAAASTALDRAHAADAAAPDRRPLAVASISILADHVRAVAGDRLRVESLVPVGGDPHTHEPVPSDARRLERAQIVFRNGLGLERWLDRLIGAPRAARPVVTVSDGIAAQVQEAGTYRGHPDPHLWMDVSYSIRYVGNVQRALAERFPQHAAEFAANAQRYEAELRRLDDDLKAGIARIPPAHRKLVTTHDAYRYFCARYGMTLVASLWGISTEVEPSAAEVAAIVRAVRAAAVPVVFVETTVNPKLMQRVAADAGVRIGRPLYGDSVGAPGSGADTYVGMMRANLASIADGLSEGLR